MNERDERLRQFFGGYFHSDWELAGAKAWRDVVTRYFMEGRPEEARRLSDDLRSWLTEAHAVGNPLAGLYEFGCYENPLADDGMTPMEWVQQIADLLDRLLTN